MTKLRSLLTNSRRLGFWHILTAELAEYENSLISRNVFTASNVSTLTANDLKALGQIRKALQKSSRIAQSRAMHYKQVLEQHRKDKNHDGNSIDEH